MSRVLLLNINYTPVSIVSWRRAVNLVLGRGKAEVLEVDNSSSRNFKPLVIRLLVKTPDHYTLYSRQKFSKSALFLRDMFLCQYCGEQCTSNTGTIDHIVPKSRGGPTTFHNCVTACKRCNFKKDNRTPAEACMVLRTHPKAPNLSEMFGYGYIPDGWKAYLGGFNE